MSKSLKTIGPFYTYLRRPVVDETGREVGRLDKHIRPGWTGGTRYMFYPTEGGVPGLKASDGRSIREALSRAISTEGKAS